MNNTHTFDNMKIVHISSLTSLHSAIFYHVVLMMKSKGRGELTDHFTMEMKHPPYLYTTVCNFLLNLSPFTSGT